MWWKQWSAAVCSLYFVLSDSKTTHATPGAKRQAFDFLKNFSQISGYVGSLDGQMPHQLALRKSVKNAHPPTTIKKFPHVSNHLFKCKHPTKQNPNIWSSPGKVSYRGLFISIKLFISILDVSKTLDAFKKSLKHIVLGDSWSIFYQELTDTPPTFKDHRIDRVSTTILAKCWPIVVWYVSQ